MSTKFQLEGIDYTSIKGKSALVVGGGSNAGLASALSLAQAGARVTIADNVSHVSVVKAFQSRGLAVQYVKCDATSWSQLLMAFKQAMQFAPTRSLDIVCSFLQIDRGQDLVDEASQIESRIDVEPLEPVMDEVDVNLRAVCQLVKLAVHYFGVPDRTTAIKKARSRSGSAATSITASSVRSRSESRSGSRPRSGSGSRPQSPDRPSPPTEPSEPVVVTEEPEEKVVEVAEDSPQDKSDEKSEDKQIKFTKSLVIVSHMAAYVDYRHSNFLAASAFALRGMFRSLRAKSVRDLSVRVNLVSPWAVRIPAIESRLRELEAEGLIERESDGKSPEPSKDIDEKNAPKPATDSSKQAVDGVANGTDSLDKAKTKADSELHPSSSTATETGSAEADSASREAAERDTSKTDSETNDDKPDSNERPSDSAGAESQTETKPDHKSEESTQDGEAKASNGVPKKSDDATSADEPPPLVKYKNMDFTSIEDIARTVTRLCADSSISGRSIAVMPEGAFDLNDDHEGGYAGDEVKKLLNMRKESGDVIYKLLNLVPETPSPSSPS